MLEERINTLSAPSGSFDKWGLGFMSESVADYQHTRITNNNPNTIDKLVIL
jgi:hypothetical protein